MNTTKIQPLHGIVEKLLVFCVGGYIALSYPQLGTSLRDAFLICSLIFTIFLWVSEKTLFTQYIHRMISDPITWGIAFIFCWGIIAALVTGKQHNTILEHLDIFRHTTLKGIAIFLAVTYVFFSNR